MKKIVKNLGDWYRRRSAGMRFLINNVVSVVTIFALMMAVLPFEPETLPVLSTGYVAFLSLCLGVPCGSFISGLKRSSP